MDVTDLGQVIGTAVASFGAAWVALPKRLKAHMAHDESLALVKQKLLHIENDVKDIENEVREFQKRFDERLVHAVSDEEFGAYTAHTSTAITALTEKIGHATGALEALYRRRE